MYDYVKRKSCLVLLEVIYREIKIFSFLCRLKVRLRYKNYQIMKSLGITRFLPIGLHVSGNRILQRHYTNGVLKNLYISTPIFYVNAGT